MEEEGHKVSLNVYDLSQGMVRQLSTTFLGRAIEGICAYDTATGDNLEIRCRSPCPTFQPPTQFQTTQSTVSVSKSAASSGYISASPEVKVKEGKGKVKSEDQDCMVPPAVKLAGAQEPLSVNRVEGDRLGDARSKVREEISKEFAAIMASGTLHASEAAALATRRVMQRYRHTNVAQS